MSQTDRRHSSNENQSISSFKTANRLKVAKPKIQNVLSKLFEIKEIEG